MRIIYENYNHTELGPTKGLALVRHDSLKRVQKKYRGSSVITSLITRLAPLPNSCKIESGSHLAQPILVFPGHFSSLIPNRNLILNSDSAERVLSRTDVPPPTAAVKPQYRPVESLAAQLQRQNLAAEGVTGYKKFKNEFQNIDLNDTRSPIPEPSQFKVKK